MLRRLVRQPLFIIGLLFIVILLIASVLFTLISHGQVPQYNLLYRHGKLVGTAPFRPSQVPPLGTDTMGYSIFFTLLKGAKFTLGFAIAVSICRVILATLIGVFFGTTLRKIHWSVSKLVDAFHYVPSVLILIILLAPVMTMNSITEQYHVTLFMRLAFEFGLVILIGLPTLSLYISSETMMVLDKEFISSAKIMGAGRLHIIKKHIWPDLVPKLWVQLVQQVIQVLILMVHLGLFKIFAGGTISIHDGMSNPSFSSSGEWAGLIGSWYTTIGTFPWIALAPLIMFALTIWAMNFIVEGLKKAIQQNDGPHLVKKQKVETVELVDSRDISQSSFTFIENKQHDLTM